MGAYGRSSAGGQLTGSASRYRGRGRRALIGVLAGATLLTPLAAAAGTGSAGAATQGSPGTASAGKPCQTPAAITTAEKNATTGITKNAVHVGNVSIISGPIAGLFEGAPVGAEAYFDYVNSKGGINGRKIYVDSYDDGFSGTTNASLTSQAVKKDFALVGSFSLFDSYGCKSLAENPAVPNVSVTLDRGTNALPNTFSPDPVALGSALGPYAFMKKKYPTAVRKVGNLVSNTSEAEANWAAQKQALEHIGYKISYVRDISPLQTDFTTDIVNMRNAGVQFLMLTDLDYQDAAVIMSDAAQQNWHPQVVFSNGPIYSPQFVKASGGPQNTKGIYLGQNFALYLGGDIKTIPAVKTFLAWVQKAKPGWSADLYTLFGWASAQLFAQALQAAGKDPTRGSVLTALSKITHFNASNLLAASDPAAKTPPNCYVLSQLNSAGQFVRIDDPPSSANSGYRCDGSYYYSTTGKTSKVPQNG